MKNRLSGLIKRVPKRAAALVLLITILGVGAYLVTQPDSPADRAKKNPNGSTADLSGNHRKNALSLAEDNVSLTAEALSARIDKSGDADSKKQAAYDNASQLGGAIKDLYGGEAQAQFNKYWKVYMDQSFKYADAVKSNKERNKYDALQQLSTNFIDPLAAYLHKINPAVTEITVRGAVSANVQDTIGYIDSYISGDKDQQKTYLQDNKQFIKTTFGFMADGASKSTNKPQNPQSNTPSNKKGPPTTKDL